MSDEVESLSSIASFGGKAQPATEAKGETAKPAEAAPPAAKESEAPAEKAEKSDRTRDESGRFTKAEEKPAEKPQEKPRADVAAIIDERRKRQAADQRAAELMKQLEAAQGKQASKPSVFENEDAAISSRVDEGTRSIRETIYKLSVKTARSIYKDFGEAEQAFLDASERDPRLIAGLQASDDPGEYIYTMGIHVRELADVGGDLMKYRDKVTSGEKARADELATQLAAMKAELDALKKAQAELESVPRSLNNTSSGPSPKAGEADDDDIRSIARFNQRR